MKASERHRDLVDWLAEAGNLSLQELSARYGISKMTAHRDLKILEDRGLLKRIHGGAVSNLSRAPEPREISEPAGRSSGQCVTCYRPVGPHLMYSITLDNGEQQMTCCPHCGVSAQLSLGPKVVMALTTDYLTGRPHPVQKSFFLLGSVAVPCCKPSMLTFDDEDMARRFQSGFGGHLGRLDDAIDFLRKEMSLHREGHDCPHCG